MKVFPYAALMAFLGTLILGLVVVPTVAWADDDTVVVVMRDMAFDPAEVIVRAGQTVRWENHERRQFHNVWFQEAGESPNPYIFPSETTEKIFSEPGRYPYVCQPHAERGMNGLVIVLP